MKLQWLQRDDGYHVLRVPMLQTDQQLRDQFAMVALQGGAVYMYQEYGTAFVKPAQSIAEIAYALADAAMKERLK